MDRRMIARKVPAPIAESRWEKCKRSWPWRAKCGKESAGMDPAVIAEILKQAQAQAEQVRILRLEVERVDYDGKTAPKFVSSRSGAGRH